MNKRGTPRTSSLPLLATSWRKLPSLPELLVWPTAAVLGYVAGTIVATDQQRVEVLLPLPVLVIALTIQPEKIFVGGSSLHRLSKGG